MKPSLLLVASLLLGACIDFDKRLASCRDDAGAWRCGDGGTSLDGGAPTDAGAADAGPSVDAGAAERASLTCTRGWCWDHPRPAGIALNAVWGTSASDVWVAGDLGTVIHFDGGTWTSYARDPHLDFTSICGHGDAVYFGASTNDGPELNDLLRWTGGNWTEIDGTRDDINQLACGESALWVARYHGASRLDWNTSALTAPFTVQGERCMGVAEVDGGCLVACMGGGTGTPFVRMHACDGALEYELVDDGGTHGDSFGVRALWTDPNRGVMAAIVGAPAQLWQREPSWSTAWSGTGTLNLDLYAGAPYANGSIAVGAGGVVLDVSDAGVSQRTVETSGNSYLRGVWSPPSGHAWMVGERGCILERDAGGWVPRSDCATSFEDFATQPHFAAVTENGFYQRTPRGWEKVKSLPPGQLALWESPDGGRFAHLTATRLQYGEALLPLTFTDATTMYVVSEQRVVIAAGSELIDTNLTTGPRAAFDAGVQLTNLSGEADGTVWAWGKGGAVFHSTSAGTWTRDDVGLTDDVRDFVIGFGRSWALSATTLSTRQGAGPWLPHALSGFDRLIPLDGDTVLTLGGTTLAARIDSSFVVTPVDSAPPTRLVGRIVRQGDELWALGWDGLVRLRP